MRKSAMVEDETKDALNNLKNRLNLKNDNDTVLFLISVFHYSKVLPKESVDLLLGLQNNQREELTKLLSTLQ